MRGWRGRKDGSDRAKHPSRNSSLEMVLLFPVDWSLKHSLTPEASDATFQGVATGSTPTPVSEPQLRDWQSQKELRRLIQERWRGEQGFEGLSISCPGQGLSCELAWLMRCHQQTGHSEKGATALSRETVALSRGSYCLPGTATSWFHKSRG